MRTSAVCVYALVLAAAAATARPLNQTTPRTPAVLKTPLPKTTQAFLPDATTTHAQAFRPEDQTVAAQDFSTDDQTVATRAQGIADRTAATDPGEPAAAEKTTSTPPAQQHGAALGTGVWIYGVALCAILAVAVIAVVVSPRRRVVNSHQYELFHDAGGTGHRESGV